MQRQCQLPRVIRRSCKQGHQRLLLTGASNETQDPRTELAEARAPVGLLQLPRTRGERFRHLEILDKVPFDLAPAYEERNGHHGRMQSHLTGPGPIGKILRRHRKDTSTILIHTMLQVCVEKRQDSLLWDTIARSLWEEAPKMSAGDLGLALSCIVKAGYSRDKLLVPELLKQIAEQAASSTSTPSTAVSSSTASLGGTAAYAAQRAAQRLESSSSKTAVAEIPTSVQGRKHMRKKEDRTASGAVTNPALPSRPSRRSSSLKSFPEYSLLAALVAAQHFRLGRSRGDDVAKICARVQRMQSSLSLRVLCRLAHQASGLAAAGSASSGRLLMELRSEFCQRFSRSGTTDLEAENLNSRRNQGSTASDMVLVAHAYAHSPSFKPTSEKALFEILRDNLLFESGLALLRLSTGELAGLVNSFAKLQAAEKFAHVELFDRIGRQLVGASGRGSSTDQLDLRSACVALNGFAQASLRHEPLFYACAELLPGLLHTEECDMRQLAMLAHAHVRVGLQHSTLLPLIWERALRLVGNSDAQSASLMLFAVTKASVVGDTAGSRLLQALGQRLQMLLENSWVTSQSAAIIAYSLSRGGCAGLVPAELWKALASSGEKGLDSISVSEAANLASALAEVFKSTDTEGSAVYQDAFLSFFDALHRHVQTRLTKKDAAPTTPTVASKLVTAFGDMRCRDAAAVSLQLAKCCLPLPTSAASRATVHNFSAAPLRSVAAALVKLGAQDEDLLQALTMAQLPSRRTRKG
eukprot:TRINITY_DN31491_c0_g1_i1.p1 TRINITY_DN31491_c0_g1~~TRINITY_DN31491_c0_g1_i1.p1  ORF type:complete len:753 (+),score=150.95 TRINITY_DN31491_c0_g1_i1:115-2373(+)